MSLAMSRRSVCRALCLPGAGWMMAGCATRTVRPSESLNQWAGRFSLTVNSDPPQSWSASFDLSGSASKGELELSSPLGSLLAAVRWSPDHAELTQGEQHRQFSSLDRLSTELAGGALPVAALFEWLRGRQAPSSGWEADLSRFGEGRILARRRHPLPDAELRVILQP